MAEKTAPYHIRARYGQLYGLNQNKINRLTKVFE